MNPDIAKLKQAGEKLTAILAKFTAAPPRVFKFMKESVTAEGVKIVTESDDWASGAEVFVEVDGNVQPAPDGEHTLNDGTVIVVSGGKITEVKAVQQEMTDVAEQVEQALSALKADSDKYAAELSKAVQLAATEKASFEAKLSAKESEITQLKAQFQTLSEQVRSIQDGGGQHAAPAQPEKSKAKMNNQERFFHLLDNMNFNPKQKAN